MSESTGIWKTCTTDLLYFDGTPACRQEGYIVRITDSSIEVSYDDEGGAVTYGGENSGNGHFNLVAPERNGKATLHRFPESEILEGYWLENEYQGMWRIHLR